MGKIIWIASYPMSGAASLQVFLANLFAPGNKELDLDTLNRTCPTLNDRALYNARLGRSTESLSEQDILQLRHEVQKSIGAVSPESVFVKTNSWFGDEKGLPLIEPEFTAGAIYVVRNPIDIAAPAAQQFGVSVQEMVALMADPNFLLPSSANHVTEYVGSWSKNVASWTWRPHPKVLTVRYESLIAAPEARFADITAFLGLKPPKEKLDRAISRSRSLWQIEQRPGREVLPQHLVELITVTHGEEMSRFGYA